MNEWVKIVAVTKALIYVPMDGLLGYNIASAILLVE